jgi:hypothetical protein
VGDVSAAPVRNAAGEPAFLGYNPLALDTVVWPCVPPLIRHTHRMDTGVARRWQASVRVMCWRRGARGPARLLVPARVVCLGLLAGLLVSACGSEQLPSRSPVPHATGSATSTPARSSQAGALTVQVPDPHCPDGVGVGINTAEWTSPAAGNADDLPGLAAAMLANGDTLVVASGAPTPDTAIAAEFRTPCELDSTFGQDGATLLANPGPGVDISDVLPTADGGALIAGSTSQTYQQSLKGPSHWLVGKLTAGGRLDQAFGNQGWATLPWDDTATSIAMTDNGNIVVGGDGDANGSSFVTELTADGTLVPTFGVAGRTRMPPWHDGGVQGVWTEPNGNILSLVVGGNMGCWGTTAVTLTPSGLRVPGFTARFDQQLRQADAVPKAGFPFFVGDVVIGAHGFHLVGTSQSVCWDNQKPDPTLRVSDIAFGYDGNLDTTFGANGATHFPASIADSAWAFPQADGSLLLATSPDNNNGAGKDKRAVLPLYRITNTGELDTNYVNDGVDDITLPYSVDSDVSGEAGPVPVSNGQHAGVLTVTRSGNAVILIPVPTR